MASSIALSYSGIYQTPGRRRWLWMQMDAADCMQIWYILRPEPTPEEVQTDLRMVQRYKY